MTIRRPGPALGPRPSWRCRSGWSAPADRDASEARNRCLDRARGDVVAMTDDDTAPARLAASGSRPRFAADPRLGGLGGPDWMAAGHTEPVPRSAGGGGADPVVGPPGGQSSSRGPERSRGRMAQGRQHELPARRRSQRPLRPRASGPGGPVRRRPRGLHSRFAGQAGNVRYDPGGRGRPLPGQSPRPASITGRWRSTASPGRRQPQRNRGPARLPAAAPPTGLSRLGRRRSAPACSRAALTLVLLLTRRGPAPLRRGVVVLRGRCAGWRTWQAAAGPAEPAAAPVAVDAAAAPSWWRHR